MKTIILLISLMVPGEEEPRVAVIDPFEGVYKGMSAAFNTVNGCEAYFNENVHLFRVQGGEVFHTCVDVSSLVDHHHGR